MPFKPVKLKDEGAIVSEWDKLAPIRYQQITSGLDITYNSVLVPEILHLVTSNRSVSAIDIGCGVGVLTARIAEVGLQVVGIDPSGTSIEIAKESFGHLASFHQSSIESYGDGASEQFDLAIANMVLMDVLHLDRFLLAVRRTLSSNGSFVFSLAHPCFWPDYYGYASEPWFEYDQQIVIEAPFRTSLAPEGTYVSTHVHRPLATYICALEKAGLHLEVLREPFPKPNLMKLYPIAWRYPHYLVGLCRI